MTTTAAVKPLLNLDGTNISWHADWVGRWERGERVAPISVDLSWGRQCQASCTGCYAALQEGMDRGNITVKDALTLLDDFKELGVKAISLVSDGESTLHPAYVQSILHAAELGLDVGNATNGWRFFPEVAEQVLPHMKWVRFTVLAGTPERFAETMHGDKTRTDLFWTAAHNISQAVQIKRKRKLDVTLGIQTFLAPNRREDIIDFVKFGLALGGLDYIVIKHFSDDEYGSYGVEYERYPEIFEALREAESMSTDETQVIVKWSKIRDGNKPPYKRFYGPAALLQISGSGLVAPSGMFFNSRYARFWIGSYLEERFRDIFRSERYWQVLNYLASPAFDAQQHLGHLPIQHYASVALDRHVKGIERIVAPSAGTPRPFHWKFV